MGRKRTSNKTNLNLWVDRDIVKLMKEWEINSSVIFTEAAKAELERLEKLTLNENDKEK